MEPATLDINQLEREYNLIIPRYKQLAKNLKTDFEQLLADEEIRVQIFSEPRIKEFLSFYEKVLRKQYANPFEQNEDFCGFRIVLFYLSDIEKMTELLKNNFDVQPQLDKTEELDVNYFGYRSKHFVATLKEDWLKIPKFKGLGELKFEIQVRTINMHSWSEASHRLDYKHEDLVPKTLRRKLFITSAFLEQVDTIFEDLNKDIEALSLNEGKLTVLSLKRYLVNRFPGRGTEHYKIAGLFEEMKEAGVSINDINKGYELLVNDLPAVEKDLTGRWPAVTGPARAILDITSNRFFENKQLSRREKWYRGVLLWREKLRQ